MQNKNFITFSLLTVQNFLQTLRFSLRPLQLTAAMIFVLCATASATNNAGMPNAIFRMPLGAWASAMGGGVSADPEQILSWYNPASLARLRDSRASLGIGVRTLGRSEGWASYDFRVPPRVGMGVSLLYRGDHDISGLYDGYYDGTEVVEERRLNDASWSAVALKIGAGYLVSRQLSFGFSTAINHQSLPTTVTDNDRIAHTSVTSIGAIDLAASYRVSQSLMLSAQIRNLLSRNTWQILSYDGFSPAIDETVPPVFVIASSHKLTLGGRDLTYNAEALFYFFDSDANFADAPEAILSAGAKWDFTDIITLRAGISDLELNASPKAALGFSYALARFGNNATFNYAIISDRLWLGVDHQFDVTVRF